MGDLKAKNNSLNKKEKMNTMLNNKRNRETDKTNNSSHKVQMNNIKNKPKQQDDFGFSDDEGDDDMNPYYTQIMQNLNKNKK
jgi:hypothetical protein